MNSKSGKNKEWKLIISFFWLNCYCSVAQSSLILCDPMNCSMQVSLSFTIQLYHPLSSPSRLVLNISQHKGFHQWVGSSYQVAKVLELPLQHQSFQWIFRVRIDWFDLLTVQGTLKRLLQHHSLKTSIFGT